MKTYEFKITKDTAWCPGCGGANAHEPLGLWARALAGI